MTSMEHFDRVEKIIKDGHGIVDTILDLEKKAKAYYEETDDEFFKELYLTLNNGLADAGRAIAVCNVKVADMQIKILSKVLTQKTEEVTG